MAGEQSQRRLRLLQIVFGEIEIVLVRVHDSGRIVLLLLFRLSGFYDVVVAFQIPCGVVASSFYIYGVEPCPCILLSVEPTLLEFCLS